MTDNLDLDKIKEETEIDNSRLEELLQKFRDDPSPETMRAGRFDRQIHVDLPELKERLEIFKVHLRKIKLTPGFDINFLTNNAGEKAIPLFTSDKKMEEVDLRSSTMVMYVEDLVNMLQGAEERYVTINPMTETGIDMPILTFLNLFKEANMDDEQKRFQESLKQMLEILKNHSMEVPEKTAFFTRAPNDFMKEAAIDGIFVPNIPFSVSTIKEFEEDMSPYINIILMDEGKKIVYFGEPVEGNPFNVLIAPETEFEMVEELDEFTTVWKCGNQPFYDK